MKFRPGHGTWRVETWWQMRPLFNFIGQFWMMFQKAWPFYQIKRTFFNSKTVKLFWTIRNKNWRKLNLTKRIINGLLRFHNRENKEENQKFCFHFDFSVQFSPNKIVSQIFWFKHKSIPLCSKKTGNNPIFLFCLNICLII